MTSPFPILNQQQPEPDYSSSPFPILNKKKEGGVFSYLGNLVKNTLRANDAGAFDNPNDPITKLIFGNRENPNPQDTPQLRQIKNNLEQAKLTKLPAYQKVKNDLQPTNFFSKLGDSIDNFFGSLSSNSVGDVAGNAITGLPMSLASMAGTPLEAQTGLALGQEGAPVMTPEERAGKIKDTAAIVLSSVVGGVSRIALTGALERNALGGVSAKVAQGILGQETETGLNVLSKGLKYTGTEVGEKTIGQLSRNILKGAVEGGLAGGTYGVVSGANEEDQFSKILQGLMFAPIGIAGEIIGAKVKGGDSIKAIQKKAADIFAMRQLQYSPDKSLFDLTNSIQAIATSNTLPEAAAKIDVAIPELNEIAKSSVKDFTNDLYNEFTKINEDPNNTKGFGENFSKFMQDKNINANDAGALRNEFINKIYTEIQSSLPEEERTFYTNLQRDIDKQNKDIVNNGTNSLKESAVKNGMYFDQHDAGVINLRNTSDNKSVGIFHSVKDAQTYLDGIGKPLDATDLDSNAKIPPDGTKPLALPSNLGPYDPPATNVSWLDKHQALAFSRLQWLTPNPSLFKNWDTMWGTKLFAEVFDPVEAAYRKYEGQFNKNVIVPLRAIKAPFNKARMTNADAEHIGNYLQTTSISEFLQNGEFGKKPLTPLDIAAAKELQKADLTAAMDYQHAMRDVDAKDTKKINALRQQFNITVNEDNALNVIDAISKQDKSLGTIYSSVKLARLMQNPELALTRAEYAKKFNMNQIQLQAANALDNFYKKQADIAGIPEEGRLANYMTHARLYEKGNIGNVINQLANSEKEKQFYAGLIRTGELSSYETDPFAAALRYGNALNRHIYMNPVISQAVKSLKEQVNGGGVPKGAGDKVLRDANQFLNDVQQRRSIGDNYANAAVDALNNHLGVVPDANVRQTWVNTINKVITASAQAGRPFVGIRNFWQNNSMYFTKWGLNETKKMLSFGAHADIENLKQLGFIQSYSPVGLGSSVDEAASQLERVGSKLRHTLDKSTDIGMKLSGQQAVNERAAAGAFLNTRSNVAEMARKLVEKKFGENLSNSNTFQKAYHSLQLERYSDPVRVEFDRLIKSNRFDDAANFLGNANVQETWGTYGNANAPSGWTNNLGRLVGKFGSWSVNHRDYIVSLASRGTRTQRLQSLGRLALTEGAIATTAATLGVNLSGFYSLPALIFNGGPTAGLVSTAMNAVFGRGQEQNNAINKVLALLPYNFEKDEFHRSIVVPFSYGIGDLVTGLDMASNGDVAGGLMQMGGIKPQTDKYQPSEWESEIGNIIGAK